MIALQPDLRTVRRGVSRRDVLRIGTLGLGGLSLPGLLAAERRTSGGSVRPARHVIMLFLSGGPSQLDTFDLKPEAPAEIRGTFRPIATSVPGIDVCEHLPRTARLAEHYALLRAVRHTQGNHPAAAYWMMIGSPIERPVNESGRMSRADRPHPGSALHALAGAPRSLPAFVMIPEAIQPNGPERSGQHAGFLGPAFDPYRINSDPNLPDYDPGALLPPADVTPARFSARRLLREQMDRHQAWLSETAGGGEFDPYYRQALEIVTSPAARAACDVSQEDDRVRDRYGRHVFGQSVLVARRLIEAGVRLVQVNWVRHDNGKGGQGFDSHRDHLAWSERELLPPTDAAFASLVEDLHERGLLDETLILMLGEFGRTPRFNRDGGRDHWPQCFCAVMAGGGIRGGQAYGASDGIGAYPTANAVSPGEIMATVYSRLGWDPHTLIHDRLNRPYPLVDAAPIAALEP